MIEPAHEAAVERLTELLERDVVTIDEFNALVARVLATTSSSEIELVLADVPVRPHPRSLVIDGGAEVLSERPTFLPSLVEIRCDSGVMKVDLSNAELEGADTDVEIDVVSGVLKVIFPRDVAIEPGDHVSASGVFKNTTWGVPAGPGVPRFIVHVRNQNGVIKLAHASRWRRRKSRR